MPRNALLFETPAYAELAFLEAPGAWENTLKTFILSVRQQVLNGGVPPMSLSGIGVNRDMALFINHPVAGTWTMTLQVVTPDLAAMDGAVRFCETSLHGPPDCFNKHNPATQARAMAWQRFIDAVTALTTTGPYNGRLQLVAHQS